VTRASQKVVLGHRRLVASFKAIPVDHVVRESSPLLYVDELRTTPGWGCCLVDQLDYHYRQCPSRRRPTPESFTERSHGSSVRETCPLTNATPCTNSLLVKTWPIILPNSFAGRITDDPGVSLRRIEEKASRFSAGGCQARRESNRSQTRLPRYRPNDVVCHYVPYNCGHPRGGDCPDDVLFHILGQHVPFVWC